MRTFRRKIVIITTIIVAVIAAVKGLSNGHFDVLQPAGTVAAQQRNLLIIATLLMLLVVIPVFILTFTIAWKYRATNKKARYEPEFDHSRKLEALWWGFPTAIIIVLAVLTWTSTHALDPSKALVSSKSPLTIQVVALQWKWLFIYPDANVASVNYVRLPIDRPVRFEITADAPMNSFWIPRLGGQIYAMPGMTTQLNLMATQSGSFHGTSANLSGAGFSRMNFIAEASDQTSYNDWIDAARLSRDTMGLSSYIALTKPAIFLNNRAYTSVEPDLFKTIVNKYTLPSKTQPTTETTVSSADAPSGVERSTWQRMSKDTQ